jgi:hypothetical protein
MPTAPKRSARIWIPSRRRTRFPGASSTSTRRVERAHRPSGRQPCRRDCAGRWPRPATAASPTGAAHGGVLGMVTYPGPDLQSPLEALLRRRDARGLDVDFHVDETGDPTVARCARSRRSCSRPASRARSCAGIAARWPQARGEADRTMDLVAEAGLTWSRCRCAISTSRTAMRAANAAMARRHAGA